VIVGRIFEHPAPLLPAIGVDLPAGLYAQLPKLATGPFPGLPRVLGAAWSLVALTDSHCNVRNPGMLCRDVGSIRMDGADGGNWTDAIVRPRRYASGRNNA
jgi:hypothetical protein